MNTTDVRIRVTSGLRRFRWCCAALAADGLPRRSVRRRPERRRRGTARGGSDPAGSDVPVGARGRRIRARRPVVDQGGPRGCASSRRRGWTANVLGDPVWAAAQPVGGFRQTFPDEAQPATERTEVRVLFTSDDHLLRRHLLRQRPGVDHHERQPARLVDDRRRQLPDGPRHVPGPAERLHLRHGRRPARSTTGQVINEGGSRGSSRRSGSGGFSRGSAGGFNLKLGRRVAGADGRSPTSAGAPSSPSRSRPSGTRRGSSSRGGSTSSATSGAAARSPTGAPLPRQVQPVPRVDGGTASPDWPLRPGSPTTCRWTPYANRRDRRPPRRGGRGGNDAGRLRVRRRPQVQHQFGS